MVCLAFLYSFVVSYTSAFDCFTHRPLLLLVVSATYCLSRTSCPKIFTWWINFIYFSAIINFFLWSINFALFTFSQLKALCFVARMDIDWTPSEKGIYSASCSMAFHDYFVILPGFQNWRPLAVIIIVSCCFSKALQAIFNGKGTIEITLLCTRHVQGQLDMDKSVNRCVLYMHSNGLKVNVQECIPFWM